MESLQRDVTVISGISGPDKTVIQLSMEAGSSRSFVDFDASARTQASANNPVTVHDLSLVHDSNMLSCTKGPTDTDKHFDLLYAVKDLQPDNHVQVRASELKLIFEQLRQLKEEIIAAKTSTRAQLSFTLFPKLPLELRRKIWSYALHVPELFVIEGITNGKDYVERFDKKFKIIRSVSKSNVMLVSNEARTEAKIALVPCLEYAPETSKTRLVNQYLRKGCSIDGRKTWFNPSTDTAWFTEPDMLQCFVEEFPKNYNIESIALSYPQWDMFHWMMRDDCLFSWYCLRIRQLREIVLVVGSNEIRVKRGHETPRTTSKPADFNLDSMSAPASEVTWEMMGKTEMQRLEFLEERLFTLKRERAAGVLNVISRRSKWVDSVNGGFTVPVVRFHVQVETLLEPNENMKRES